MYFFFFTFTLKHCEHLQVGTCLSDNSVAHHAQKPKQKRNLTVWGFLNNNKLTMSGGPGSPFGVHR